MLIIIHGWRWILDVMKVKNFFIDYNSLCFCFYHTSGTRLQGIMLHISPFHFLNVSQKLGQRDRHITHIKVAQTKIQHHNKYQNQVAVALSTFRRKNSQCHYFCIACSYIKEIKCETVLNYRWIFTKIDFLWKK